MAIDLLMKFVKGQDAIDADAVTTIDSNDILLLGFKQGKFFEIDEFSFGVGIEDNDSSRNAPVNPQIFGEFSGNEKQKALTYKQKSRFEKWLKGEKTNSYPVDLEPFEFSRQMDQASPLLFEMCCTSQSFTSASLVKRKFAGKGVSGYCFLRIDFTDVLVINVDWDSGDVVKEKVKFISRGVSVQYRPQMANGQLGSIIPGQWKYPMAR